jgi:hypothetical protein
MGHTLDVALNFLAHHQHAIYNVQYATPREWRNGRRAGLRIQWGNP